MTSNVTTRKAPEGPAPEKPKPRLTVVFYKTPAGDEPVREWLQGMGVDARKKFGEAIKTVQWKWPNVTEPLVKTLLPKLAEVRVSLAEGAGRVFYTVKDQKMFLLHGIVKKRAKTPKAALVLVTKRMREVQQ